MTLWEDLIGIFRKKRKLRAILLDEVGNVLIKNVGYENNTFTIKISGSQQTYIVDMNYVTYDKKTSLPVSFYYVNNPNPIRMRHERNKDVDSIGFKKILDSKTIQDLFSQESANKFNIMLIIVGINILLSIFIILLQTGVIKVHVSG